MLVSLKFVVLVKAKPVRKESERYRRGDSNNSVFRDFREKRDIGVVTRGKCET